MRLKKVVSSLNMCLAVQRLLPKVSVFVIIVITIEDPSSWKKVEQGIERYMLADKKEIIVKLSMLYTKINEISCDSSDDKRRPRKKVIVLVCC